MKTRVENALNNLFNFQVQTTDVSDQAVSTLKYLGLHYEKGKKTNISDPLTETQSISGYFLSFMIKIHTY